MRQFLSGITLGATLLFAHVAPVAAQNPFEPVLYVNDRAITRYEVSQRQRFQQLLGGSAVDAKTAEEALIDDRLRIFAASQMGIDVPDEGLRRGLEEFASRAGLSAAEFIAQLESAGVEHQVFRDFVKAGVAWRGVIRDRMIPQITVSETEVDRALQKRIETPVITRVLLSELIIPAPPGQEEAAMQRANSIAAAGPSEGQFAEAARRYSASDSAGNGGRLPWVAIDNLPPQLRPVILGLTPGQTSQPLTVPGAVILFRLRDNQGTLRPGAKEQVIDYITLRLSSAEAAAELAAKTRSCEDFYVQAGKEAAQQINRQEQLQNQIPALIATRLASLDPDEAAVQNLGNGADVIMLCSRRPALLVENENQAESASDVATTAAEPDNVEAAVPDQDALPSRDAIREQLFNRKANEMADAYLQELRADAVIRRP